jgi:paraquat-inducible protein B
MLYASRSAAQIGLSGPTVRYDFAFDGTAGDLDEDSPVTLLGFQIGEVESAHLTFDPRTGKPYTTVTAVLYPQQLGLAATGAGAADDWRAATDAKVRKLLHFGYRARLQQTPPLLGNLSIALAEVKGAAVADLADDGPNPRIPSAPGSADFADITSQADQILAKINRIPIEEIGQDLRQVTQRLNALSGSPQLSAGLSHLNSTLAELDQLLAQVQPQIGPLMTKLNDAAAQLTGTALAARQLLDSQGDSDGASLAETVRQLNEAARSIRSLTDYLGRHPEALIRGKRPE